MQARAHAAAVEARAEVVVAEVRHNEQVNMAAAEQAIRQAQFEAGAMHAQAEQAAGQMRRGYSDEQTKFQTRIDAERISGDARVTADRQAREEGDRLLGQLQSELHRVERLPMSRR